MDTVQSLREGVLQVEKFANLEDVRSRADRHGSKLNGVKESMMSLVHSVQSEIKERVDANKALNAMFESQVQAIQDRLEFVFMKKLDRLDHSVAAISQRMSVVERDFALTREKHMQDMLRRNQHLAQDAEKFMSALRSERADRQHRADGFARQLSDYEAKTRTLISSQMQMREQQYQSLREQLDEVKRKSDTGDDELQRDLEEKVADIKAMLAVEQKARTQADDDIMQALKHYTTCIQEALRTINQN